jgi:hypothetical protein
MLFCVFFPALFVTYFVHNFDATIAYDWKEVLDIRTAITHLELDKDFFFNESDAKDIRLPRDQAQIPVIHVKKRQKYRWRRLGCLVRISQWVGNPSLPSTLLANMQSLENNLSSRLYYERDIKNCNILCFTESWLKDNNIQLAGFSVHRQDRTDTVEVESLHTLRFESLTRF